MNIVYTASSLVFYYSLYSSSQFIVLIIRIDFVIFLLDLIHFARWCKIWSWEHFIPKALWYYMHNVGVTTLQTMKSHSKIILLLSKILLSCPNFYLLVFACTRIDKLEFRSHSDKNLARQLILLLWDFIFSLMFKMKIKIIPTSYIVLLYYINICMWVYMYIYIYIYIVCLEKFQPLLL